MLTAFSLRTNVGDVPRIPILPVIDYRLSSGSSAVPAKEMDADQQAYRLAARVFADMAQIVYGRPFEQLSPVEQDELLKSVHEGHPAVARDLGAQARVKNIWEMIVSDCACIYQSHLMLGHEDRASISAKKGSSMKGV